MNNDREKIILETLKAKQSVDVKQLCKLLYASESTVRRTLTNLEKKGLIIRAHGKALDAGVYADKNIAFFLRENVAVRTKVTKNKEHPCRQLRHGLKLPSVRNGDENAAKELLLRA